MLRGQGARGALPPRERVDVMSLATSQPADSHGPATRWSLDERATTRLPAASALAMSRSTVGRRVDDADLPPHRRVYGLTSPDPAFASKARALCDFSVHALRFSPEGRLVIWTDEKTGRQMLQRQYPTQRRQPGKPAKREQDYMRHGPRALLASCVVPTGQVVWHLSPPRTRTDGAGHLAKVVQQLPDRQRYDGVVDHLQTPWRLDVCRLVARWCALPLTPKTRPCGAQRRAFLSDPTPPPVCHCTPPHGAWLNQVEFWCSVLARRGRKRGDVRGVEDCATQWGNSLEVSNTHQAHPYRWTYTGHPLVRATPLRQTRRQQRQGRAWFSPRPQRFARAFSPPRPYKRAPTPLVMNL